MESVSWINSKYRIYVVFRLFALLHSVFFSVSKPCIQRKQFIHITSKTSRGEGKGTQDAESQRRVDANEILRLT